jgi:hypothetical protein
VILLQHEFIQPRSTQQTCSTVPEQYRPQMRAPVRRTGRLTMSTPRSLRPHQELPLTDDQLNERPAQRTTRSTNGPASSSTSHVHQGLSASSPSWPCSPRFSGSCSRTSPSQMTTTSPSRPTVWGLRARAAQITSATTKPGRLIGQHVRTDCRALG